MALWGNLDTANNAPKQTDTPGYGGSTPQVTANGQVYYGNTKTDAFITNAQIGIFGIDTTEKGITTGEAPPHNTLDGIFVKQVWVQF